MRYPQYEQLFIRPDNENWIDLQAGDVMKQSLTVDTMFVAFDSGKSTEKSTENSLALVAEWSGNGYLVLRDARTQMISKSTENFTYFCKKYGKCKLDVPSTILNCLKKYGKKYGK